MDRLKTTAANILIASYIQHTSSTAKTRSFHSLINEVVSYTRPVENAAIQGIQESWLLPTERASAVKTRMNGLSCGEKIMTIRSAVLIQYQRVTDRQTDGQNLDS